VFGSAARGHFSPIPDSGPSASLRDRGRFVWSSWFRLRRRGFAFGIVPGGVSRSISGRCARGGSVVRFLQRAVLFEVSEDGADGGGFFDAGHDPHRAAAVAARAHVDVDQIAWSDLEQPKGWPEGRRAGCPE